LEVPFTTNENVPAGVGAGGLLLPPQDVNKPKTKKQVNNATLLRDLPDATRARANTAASEYQSLKPGRCKAAEGRAVVFTSRRNVTNSLPGDKAS